MAARGDDITCSGLKEDLMWLKELTESWLDIELRGILGLDEWDKKGNDYFGEDCESDPK